MTSVNAAEPTVSARQAGLTVRAFAALLGQASNSITNYASKGDVPTHLAIIATLMADLAWRARCT